MMYCHYNSYSPLESHRMLPQPYIVPSQQLFKIISIALNKNLQAFKCEREAQAALISIQKPQISLQIEKQGKIKENIIIDLTSDFQEIEPEVQSIQSLNIFNQNKLQKPILKENKISSFKNGLQFKTKQNQGSFLTPSIIYEENFQNSNNKIQQPVSSAQISINKINEFEYIQPSIQCPKLGLSKNQLLKKKESLLLRKVNDWSEISSKGIKQKRELRYLIH